ncbi:MAG: DoxX family protein, partial [Sphingomonadales bacterium]
MSKQNLFIPALGGLYEKLEPFALPLLRIIIGVIFFLHGFDKFQGFLADGNLDRFAGYVASEGFEPGYFWGWLTLLTEMVGGLMLALGLFTRLAAAFLTGMMIIIIIWFKSHEAFLGHKGGFEYEFVYALLAFTFL